MKKIIVSLIFIVITAVLSGCADDQYAIERRYWRIQKQAMKIFKNPKATPSAQLSAVVQSMLDFSNKHPKSPLSVDAGFDIVRLYIVKDEYVEARAAAKRLIDKHLDSELVCVEATFLTGNAYEQQGKWDQALEQYRLIMRKYPATRRGLDIPIYIAQYYKKKFQPEKMVVALQGAVEHYRSVALRYPNTPLALTGHNLVGECYLALKEWQNAVDTFESVIHNYKDKAVMDNIMLNMALIYQRELKDEAKAVETLQRLIREYPKSRLVKQATALLDEWSK